jgi:DNA invertase Pin-like site-specific DNA recombinase
MADEQKSSISRAVDSTTPRPCLCYGRFSPRPTFRESLDCIEVQEEICRAYCLQNNLNIVAFLRDPLVSARQVPLFERPEGGKIPTFTSSGIKDIVCVRLDRMFRNTVDGLNVFEQWVEDGVRLHLANQGGCSVSCVGATGKLIATCLLSIAEYEPNITSERTSASMKSKQSRGQRMTHEDKLPWGWMVDPDSKDNERGRKSGMIPCQYEREQTVWLRCRISEGLSLSGLAEELNASGDFNRGKPWNHKSVKRAAEAKWS